MVSVGVARRDGVSSAGRLPGHFLPGVPVNVCSAESSQNPTHTRSHRPSDRRGLPPVGRRRMLASPAEPTRGAWAGRSTSVVTWVTTTSLRCSGGHHTAPEHDETARSAETLRYGTAPKHDAEHRGLPHSRLRSPGVRCARHLPVAGQALQGGTEGADRASDPRITIRYPHRPHSRRARRGGVGRLQGFSPPTSPLHRHVFPRGGARSFHGIRSPPRSRAHRPHQVWSIPHPVATEPAPRSRHAVRMRLSGGTVRCVPGEGNVPGEGKYTSR